jgi:hypothetical protein
MRSAISSCYIAFRTRWKALDLGARCLDPVAQAIGLTLAGSRMTAGLAWWAAGPLTGHRAKSVEVSGCEARP